jgi:hypothetical protein
VILPESRVEGVGENAEVAALSVHAPQSVGEDPWVALGVPGCDRALDIIAPPRQAPWVRCRSCGHTSVRDVPKLRLRSEITTPETARRASGQAPRFPLGGTGIRHGCSGKIPHVIAPQRGHTRRFRHQGESRKMPAHESGSFRVVSTMLCRCPPRTTTG